MNDNKYSDIMKNSSNQIDRKILKTLEPLNKLNPILLDELAAKSVIEEVQAGRTICRHGDSDSRQIYLLAGQIEVATAGENKTKVIKSKSALKTPIAAGSPRTVTLKAKTNSTLLHIDADLLELLMSDELEVTASSYEVNEFDGDDSDDWMLTFLQSPAFLQLPTENIQKLLTHMDEIPVKKDQIVIKQGDKDDNYYILKSGTCNVHRKPYETAANVLLAVLPTGSGFGEEALISNGSRNATITMREDGSLMRLKKKDFLSLLITPLISYFEHSEMQSKLNEGCVVIDVRPEQQSKQTPLKDAVNIPLSMLRIEFDNLNAEREYLLLCNDGSQSAAAAFLMIQNGLKCNVLKGGIESIKEKKKEKPAAKTKEDSLNKAANEQSLAAKQQAQQIAQQQEQIKADREKSEQDIAKHKKELAESRKRISEKNHPPVPSADQVEMLKLKEKAAQEFEKAQAESKAVELRQQETAKNVLRAEEMIKQSTAAAEQTRQQAEQEATLIKQRALEEAEKLRAEKEQAEQAKAQAEKAAELIKQRAIDEAEQARVEKAAQELAKAQAENEAIKIREQETNKAMRQAEEIMKQSAIAAEQARAQAEQEAALIKQRALEEAAFLRAEVEAAQQKMEQDSVQLKKEEETIKRSALKIKSEADKIRREALNDAEQVKAEIEATRLLLNEKLQRAQDEEQRQHDAILAEAQKDADKLAAIKTQQADIEAEAIKQKAQEDAARLHNELLETRKQIEAEAARVINELKEKAKAVEPVEEQIPTIKDEVLVEIVDEDLFEDDDDFEIEDNFKAVSIPGIPTIEPIDDNTARLKAEAIKEKLAQSQVNRAAQKTADNVKIHKSNEHTILESKEDLFIFQEPKMAANEVEGKNEQPVVSQRTRAESALTQISIEPQKSVVIYPQQEQETALRNNIFLNQQEQEHTSTSYNTKTFDKQAYMKQHKSSQSNTFAIAASFLLILAGAVFTLHATDTLKVQSIAALFNSGNDSAPAVTAIAKTKTIRKKVLRADTKVNVKKKVGNKMDNIMQGWKDVLSESKNPKKLKDNK